MFYPQTHPDDHIWHILDLVGMKEAISALKDKLETVLEDSVGLSRGQRQLTCLARVFLQKRKIVILDEASSSMDVETDEKVQRVISEHLKDCTVLAIAHHISTIVNFDLVMVLDGGELAETGDPRALLKTESSRFAKLAKGQGIAI
ncbi:P-loop containing nucleoside triphosphate hydrolase protein [Ceratobasidium sp. AG-I]|nr:P-loop containing nucleoside triphosphate hydrolase protein [Ceratobasidium sp. AG-I]